MGVEWSCRLFSTRERRDCIEEIEKRCGDAREVKGKREGGRRAEYAHV